MASRVGHRQAKAHLEKPLGVGVKGPYGNPRHGGGEVLAGLVGEDEAKGAGQPLRVLPKALVEVPHLEEEEVVRVAVAELHVLLQKRGKWTWAFALEHVPHLNPWGGKPALGIPG